MATRGVAAFDTDDPKAKNSHQRLLEVSAVIKDDIQLAVHFGVSIPTIRKWRSKPIGYKPGLHGRRKRKKNGPPTEPEAATTVTAASQSSTEEEE